MTAAAGFPAIAHLEAFAIVKSCEIDHEASRLLASESSI